MKLTCSLVLAALLLLACLWTAKGAKADYSTSQTGCTSNALNLFGLSPPTSPSDPFVGKRRQSNGDSQGPNTFYRRVKFFLGTLVMSSCFLARDHFQERITTMDYAIVTDPPMCLLLPFANQDTEMLSMAPAQPATGTPREASVVKFSDYTMLNFFQSLGAALLAFIVLQSKISAGQGLGPIERSLSMNVRLFLSYMVIGSSYVLGSEMGYHAMGRLGFLASNIGKSCSVVPIMLFSFLFTKKGVTLATFTVSILVAIGVGLFMYCSPNAAAKGSCTVSAVDTEHVFDFSHSISSRAAGGLFLAANMLLDGVTSGLQDNVFQLFQVDCFHMMLHLNLFSCIALGTYLLLFRTRESLMRSFWFLMGSASFARHLLIFVASGAVGQALVYYFIRGFGSLANATVLTVKKFATALFSIFYFGHTLAPGQWLAVFLVFFALFLNIYFAEHGAQSPEASPGSSNLDVL